MSSELGKDQEGVRQAVDDLYAALARDDALWVSELVAHDPGALVVGTDASEWWEGFDAINEGWAKARSSYGGTDLQSTRPHIQAHGGVAWVADEPRYALSSGDRGQFRLTMVFVQSPDRWRLIHLHASVAV